jgi:hypothetical protein
VADSGTTAAGVGEEVRLREGIPASISVFCSSSVNVSSTGRGSAGMATAAGGGVGAGGGGAMGSGAVGGKGCLALWWLRDIGEYSLGVVTVLDHVYGLNGAAVDAAVGANDLFALDGADLGEIAGEDEGLGGEVAEGARGGHADAARLRVVLSKLDIHGHFIGDRPAEGVEDAAYVLRVYVRGQG